ncbi:MAG TPA: response regulator [Acidobacteriota bacterium]|nr:response regulator [Acidobacteriota bacterium]
MPDIDRCILIIDDDEAILDHVGAVLRGAGFRTTLASNGLDGLKQLNSVEANLVILDVTMPEMDGLQTCRMIRATDKHKNLPILILTSRGDITDMMEARKVGADDYLVKPVDPQLLLKKIERLFAR